MSFLGVCVPDLHIDKLTKYWSDANTMQCRAVRKTLDAAIREGCTRSFYLGDLAEGIRDSTGNAMRLSENGQIELLKLFLDYDDKLETDVILGNHDWASEGNHSLGMFMELQQQGVFKHTRFHATLTKAKIGNTKVAFMPFPNTEPPAGTQLAFAHYEVKGAIGDNGRMSHSEFEAPHRCPTVQGHLHTKQKVGNHYYPGTLYQTSFGESMPKGYMLIQSDGQRFKQRWTETLPPFQLVNLKISDPKDFKQLTKNPNILYKLFVHEDIGVPDSLLTEYPNIVNRLAFATDQEAVALEQEEYESENHLVDLDHRKELPAYLKSKGATRKQVDRALEVVDSYRSGK